MKVSILGCGAFAIAISTAIAKTNSKTKISMWTKFKEEKEEITKFGENKRVLPGVKVPNSVKITTDIEESIKDSSIVFFAIPAVALREVSKDAAKFITKEQIICIATKGIENVSNKYMSEIIEEEIKTDNICVLSGPSFAIEVATGIEIGFVVATKCDKSVVNTVKSCIENNNLLVSVTDDIIGVQIGAAIKNVFAIFCGMLEGMKKSDSTKAAILTNLIQDYKKMITSLGGKEDTIYTYAGIGDMLLTCMSDKSRNYTFGRYIGEGLNIEEALESMNTKTVEGLYTITSIYELLSKKNIKVNSIFLLYNMLYNNKKVDNILLEINKGEN